MRGSRPRIRFGNIKFSLKFLSNPFSPLLELNTQHCTIVCSQTHLYGPSTVALLLFAIWLTFDFRSFFLDYLPFSNCFLDACAYEYVGCVLFSGNIIPYFTKLSC